MNSSPPDLRSLASARNASAGARAKSSAVPRPAARWRTRILVPGVVILATASVLAYAARDTFQTRTAVWVAAAIPAATEASTADTPASETPESASEGSTSTEPGAVLVQAPGWVEPSPYSVGVPALTEGVVREVLVLEGESVRANQIVVRLIDEDLKLQLRATQAALAEREADVERAKSAVATAEAQVRVEQAAADELRDEVTSKRDLVSTGGIGAGEFRRKEIRLSGLDAKVVAMQRLADEAKAALRQTGSAVIAARVVVDEANLRLERTEVRSPVSGVVLARLVDPGSRISMAAKGAESSGMSGTVLRLYDPARLQVRVDVPLADAAKVGVGTPCSITSEALPDATFQGRVIRVVHEANIQRNTVQFKVSIEAPSPVLKPEMLARVKLHAPAGRRGAAAAPNSNRIASDDLVLLIPTAAATATTTNAASVWIVELTSGSPVARRREVQTSSSTTEGYTLVQSGLRLTDRVILDAPSRLHDGSPLRVLGERTTSQPTP